MKKVSTALYILFALLFIVGIIIKNKYVLAAGFLFAAIYWAISAVISSKRRNKSNYYCLVLLRNDGQTWQNQ